MLRYSRRQFALALLASVAGVSSTGCGTLLYPERRGQPKGRLDWGVVGLDGLGLLLFLVPGIIAFAVDFYTGAIYLPPETPAPDGYSDASRRSAQELQVVQLTPDELTDERIATVVAAHIGRPVNLAAANCRREPLPSLKQFWGTHDRLVAEMALPTSDREALRAQSR
jgi:hypothetical protein